MLTQNLYKYDWISSIFYFISVFVSQTVLKNFYILNLFHRLRGFKEIKEFDIQLDYFKNIRLYGKSC